MMDGMLYDNVSLSELSLSMVSLQCAMCGESFPCKESSKRSRPALLTSHLLHGTHSTHCIHGIHGILISSPRFSSAHTSITIGTCAIAMVAPLGALGGAIPIAAQASGSTFHCESFAFPSLTATSLIFASIAALDVTLSK
jgi:hypothetical protein